MNRVLKAFCLAATGVSLTMCNLEDAPEEALLVEEAAPAAIEISTECVPQTQSLTSGINDTFNPAGAAEPTNPRPDLITWINSVYTGLAGSRDYDEYHLDQYLAHSWSFAPPTTQHYLSGATVLGRVQCRDSNESLYFGFVHPVTGLSPEPYLGGNLSAAPISADCPNRITKAFTYNINGLVPKMKIKGFLDVFMQDDSQMDYLTLRLNWSCYVRLPPAEPQLP